MTQPVPVAKNTLIIPRWLALGLTVAAVGLACAPTTAAEASRTCTYDPDLGLNPLGMRAYITLTETEGHTTVTFEQFPTPIGGDANQPVTLASMRALTFYDLGIEATREALLSHPDYYRELVGYADPEGFGPVNAVMSCAAN